MMQKLICLASAYAPLDYAGSVDEAVELVKKYDLHDSANTSFHYMVADSTGKSAILEWVNGTDDANQFQYVTNFIVTPDYYTNESDMKGLDRYNAIENKINPDGNNINGIISEETAMDVLELIGRRNWDALNGKSDNNAITVWSALYNLTDKTVTWVSNEEFENEKAVFTFDFGYVN